jgi:hypothetical protein
MMSCTPQAAMKTARRVRLNVIKPNELELNLYGYDDGDELS